MIIQEPIQAAIWHCLNHYDHKNAIFLAERLCSEVENDETVFLLATSYFRSNLIHQAHWLLKEKVRLSPQCRFLQAKCAFLLKNYSEAECALDINGFSDPKFDELANEMGDVACFALGLVAEICLRTERSKLAACALRKALKLNPFMWNSFASLCEMGQDVDASSIFNISSTDVFNTCQGNIKSNTAIIFGSSNAMSDNSNTLSQQNMVNSQYTLETLMNITNSNSYILSTPVDQLLQHNLVTPNNNENRVNSSQLNSSMNILRGVTAGTVIQPNRVPNILLDDTSIGYLTESIGAVDVTTPYRKQFKYLSTFSPTTPSFGILPINTPNKFDSPQSAINQNGSNPGSPIITPSPQKLAENQEPKMITKKIKTHTSGIIHRKESTAGTRSGIFAQTGNLTPRTPNNSVNITAPGVRRSSRLFGNSAYSVKENNKSPNITTGKFAQPRSPARKPKTRMSKICLSNELIEDKAHAERLPRKDKEKEKVETITLATSNNRDSIEDKVLLNNSFNSTQTMMHHLLLLKKQSADGLMNLLRDLGEGFKLLANYQCNAAIKHLERTIPKRHLNSSWVQSLIGHAAYEMRQYDRAVAIFKRIHDTEPHRLEGMEIYSSSLWQLQKEVDLSALSRDFINQDKLSPVTWCIAGNCFSLQKEHDTAIKFFKRAVQVDPDFVYSYTLLGHELVLIEEFDKATQYFRSAVERDPRHYNAWFGIGTIYSKQEKYELAELHYMKALKINPQNTVILVHIGAMQYFMHKQEQALNTLNKAAALDPENPLSRFHRGSIYFSMGKYTEALQELEELKEIVPKESVVFYLIGKIHKALGNVHMALMHFSWATELDPKGSNNQIKDAYDSMANAAGNTTNESNLEAELDTSEQSDESTQAQQDANYESDY